MGRLSMREAFGPGLGLLQVAQSVFRQLARVEQELVFFATSATAGS
jgi:hypothetical protein